MVVFEIFFSPDDISKAVKTNEDMYRKAFFGVLAVETKVACLQLIVLTRGGVTEPENAKNPINN